MLHYRIGRNGALLNDHLSYFSLSVVVERGLYFFRQFEVFLDPIERVQAIVDVDADSSDGFHGLVAHSEQRQHHIDLFDSDGVFLIHVIEGDCRYDKDGQHEKRDVIECHIVVEDVVVMVFLNKQVIVLLS